MSLEPYAILRGAIYSMEAALSFLRDAIWLYRNQRYASAAILGATATEHMGRTIWLIGKRQAADSGEVLDLKRFKTALGSNHEDKIRRSQVVFSFTGPPGFDLSRLDAFEQGSPEQEAACAEILKDLNKIRNRAPAKLHELRCRSQYVELTDDGTDWTRPSDVEKGAVHDMLLEAGNRYRGITLFILPKCAGAIGCMEDLGLLETLRDFANTYPPPEGDLK